MSNLKINEKNGAFHHGSEGHECSVRLVQKSARHNILRLMLMPSETLKQHTNKKHIHIILYTHIL